MNEDRRSVGLRIKAFNAPLRKARMAVGYDGVKALADALGWPYSKMLDIENLKRWPDEESQIAIAVHLGVPADALFPEELREVTGAPTTLEIAVTVQAAAALGRQAALDAADPMLLLESEWRQQAVDEALETLTPRERKVIARRFGLDDGNTRTLAVVSAEMNVTKERVRQIEAKALRKLRHPRHVDLREFRESDAKVAPEPISEEAAYWQQREKERETR